MDVKKIKLEHVKDGSLKYELVRKELQKCITEMESKHTDFDNSTEFYAYLDQTYDNGKTQDLLFVIGSLKTSWKPHVNAQYKDGTQKKMVLAGDCYLEIINGQKTLQLIPQKGAAKFPKITKAGKALFKKAGIVLNIPKEFATEELMEDEKEPTTKPTEKEDKNLDGSPTPYKSETAKALDKIWAEFKSISTSLKELKDPSLKVQAHYQLIKLNEKFVQTMIQYNEEEGNNNATEKLLPGVAAKIAGIKKQLDENASMANLVILGDTFKKKVERLNQLLTALKQPTIDISSQSGEQ